MFNINKKEKFREYSISNSASSKLVTKIFGWMFVALVLTALTAWKVVTTESLFYMVRKSFTLLIILEFGVVIGLSFLINKISANVAKLMFLSYAILNGFTFSVFMIIFTPMSVIFTLGLTTLIFAVMAVYGYTTKEDLSNFRSMLYVGLIVLIISSVINMFLHSTGLYWIISYMGVFIFIGLIGYDVNRIKHMVVKMSNGNTEVVEKYAIFGALQLYLDFINLFIYLLRIFGKKN